MKFIENPNLPQNRVGVVAINATAYKAIGKLNNLGIKTIPVLPDNRLPKPVNSHADMQILHIGKNHVLIQNEHLYAGDLNKDFILEKIYETPGNMYPFDVKLNCKIINDKIICNKKTISKYVLEFAEKAGLNVINVNQGYSGCSVCAVNENAILTDDKSIFTAAGNFFNDALLVSKGSVRLKGYNYGFIGGCCGKIDKNKIAFNGAIESHSDYKLILDFLDRNKIECVELHNEPLSDIGGILPLMEL